MKENREVTDTNVEDIEEAIERLEYIDRTYSYNNYYSIWDLKCIEILLSDYKRVLKENEELNEKILDNAGIYQLGFKDGEKSYIKKVKDKIEEEKLPLVIVGGRRNKRTLEYGIKLGRRQALQELLGSEE